MAVAATPDIREGFVLHEGACDAPWQVEVARFDWAGDYEGAAACLERHIRALAPGSDPLTARHMHERHLDFRFRIRGVERSDLLAKWYELLPALEDEGLVHTFYWWCRGQHDGGDLLAEAAAVLTRDVRNPNPARARILVAGIEWDLRSGACADWQGATEHAIREIRRCENPWANLSVWSLNTAYSELRFRDRRPADQAEPPSQLEFVRFVGSRFEGLADARFLLNWAALESYESGTENTRRRLLELAAERMKSYPAEPELQAKSLGLAATLARHEGRTADAARFDAELRVFLDQNPSDLTLDAFRRRFAAPVAPEAPPKQNP